jgi:hypothetical protein
MATNRAPAFGSDESHDDRSESSSTEGGLFLTAIHETTTNRPEPKPDNNVSSGSLHEKLISTVIENIILYNI